MNISAVCNALPQALKPVALTEKSFKIHVEGDCTCKELHAIFKHYVLDIGFELNETPVLGDRWVRDYVMKGIHPHVDPEWHILCLDWTVMNLALVKTEADLIRYVLAVVAALPNVDLDAAFYSEAALLSGWADEYIDDV